MQYEISVCHEISQKFKQNTVSKTDGQPIIRHGFYIYIFVKLCNNF